MQRCKAVSAWLELAVGAALPYCILRWLEQRGRAAFAARQWRRGQQQVERASPAPLGGGMHPYMVCFVCSLACCLYFAAVVV